jgi:hypothetical protein
MLKMAIWTQFPRPFGGGGEFVFAAYNVGNEFPLKLFYFVFFCWTDWLHFSVDFKIFNSFTTDHSVSLHVLNCFENNRD